MQCTECRALLDARHDGELMPEELDEVRVHLDLCTECAGDAEELRRASRLVRESLPTYVAPDVLRARIVGAIAREHTMERPIAAPLEKQRGRPGWWRLAAAGVVIAAVSSAATIAATSAVGRGRASARTRDEIVSNHIRSLMPGHLIDVASSDQHNVKPWFNGRVDLSPTVPGLDSAGFRLVGGRLDYLADRNVAVVVYQRRQHLIDVYSWPTTERDATSAVDTDHGYHLMRWRHDGVEIWAVSDLNVPELTAFVRAFQSGGGPSR